MLSISVAVALAVSYFLVCFPFPSVAAANAGPQLADVNVLLPPKMTYPVEYRLQGSDGCFIWSWDHHDILAVLPEYDSGNGCSTSALLKSIAPYSGRKETAVYAADLSTRMVIVCKVYIDIFSRIQIFYNSSRIYLDELATLQVRAFDSEENVFSSLLGLQFMWQRMTKVVESPHRLVHVPLKDSPKIDCGGSCGSLDVQIKLEDDGVFSDLYVVKGIAVGYENVSVHLMEPSFEHMHDKIVMTVLEVVTIDPPSPIFVLVDAVVKYTLTVTRGNISRVVHFRYGNIDRNYKWYHSNSSVAFVSKFTGLVCAINLGTTTITVKDSREVGLVVQTSSVQVVLPDTLFLYIEPLSPFGSLLEGMTSNSSMVSWYIVSGRHYIIQVKVFSQRPGAEEIYITERDDIMIYDDHSELWNFLLPATDSVAVNKTTRILEPLSCGLGKLVAAVNYSSELGGRKEVLKAVQEVTVCNEVQFIMGQFTGELNRILLPWAPGISQELGLRVTGGCATASSDYKWFSSEITIVTVSASGIITSKSPGRATIKAVSMYDSSNFDEIGIEVTFPSSLTVHAPKEMLTNAPPHPAKGYFFPVKLADAYSHKYETTGYVKKFFDCEVEPPYVGFAKAWFDLFTGRFYCIFFPYSPEHLLRTAPDSADIRRGLAISIRASLLEDSSISDSASAIFLGGFSLLGADESSLQLNLSYPNKGYFIIVGNTDVKINWHMGFKLSLTFIGGKDWKKGGSAFYEVMCRTNWKLEDKLIITLPTTGQRTELDVHCKGRTTKDATISYFYYRLVVATLACIVCSLAILQYIPS